MDSPVPQLPGAALNASLMRGLWIAWIANAALTPLLAVGAMLLSDRHSSIAFLVGGLAACGCMAHVALSTLLAHRISLRRSAETRTGALIGMGIGLFFAGIGVMGAVFFCGCLAAIATQ